MSVKLQVQGKILWYMYQIKGYVTSACEIYIAQQTDGSILPMCILELLFNAAKILNIII